MAASNFATTIKTPISSILLLLLIHVSVAQAIGVCYGKLGNNLPSEPEVVDLYKSNCIKKMRIFGPNITTLEALRGTDIDLILDAPDYRTLADPIAATNWVHRYVVNYSNVNFRYIAVGNEVRPSSDHAQYVLPAMKSIQAAISAANLASKIKVSTATFMELIANSYPPDEGVFTNNSVSYMAPIVSFLKENDAPLLVNIYPYFAHVMDKTNIKLTYALFETSDGPTGYRSLFDAQLDSIYAALEKVEGVGAGEGRVRVVVSETGWPSGLGEGPAAEAATEAEKEAATVDNAGRYYRNLVNRLKSGGGTRRKPGFEIETYLFAMFDENQKDGGPQEKHFGLFYPNKTLKYHQLSFC